MFRFLAIAVWCLCCWGCQWGGRETFEISPPPKKLADTTQHVALEALSDAILTNPSVADNYVKRAALYLAAGKVQEARVDIDRAENLTPNNPQILHTKALVLQAQKNSKEALSYAQRVEPMRRESFEVQLLMADLYSQVSNTGKALQHLQLAQQMAPYSSEVFRVRGQIHLLNRDTTSAISEWVRSLELNPNESSSYQSLISLYDARGLADSSLRLTQQAVVRFPNEIAWQIGKGERLERMLLIDSAVVVYSRVRQQFPAAKEVLIKMGKARLRQKDFPAALPFFEEAAKSLPQNADAHYYLGLTKENLKNYQGALDAYVKALRINSEMQVAKEGLERANYKITLLRGY